jgi:hypothetical protein
MHDQLKRTKSDQSVFPSFQSPFFAMADTKGRRMKIKYWYTHKAIILYTDGGGGGKKEGVKRRRTL